jgi:hypothetical protein
MDRSQRRRLQAAVAVRGCKSGGVERAAEAGEEEPFNTGGWGVEGKIVKYQMNRIFRTDIYDLSPFR